MKIHARLMRGAAFAAAIAFSLPAHAAGVPVIDAPALIRIKQTVDLATKQLGAIQQQVSQVTQMRNTIGQIGPGKIGDMLAGAGLDFSGPLGVLRDVSAMKNQVKSMTDTVSQLKLPGEANMQIGNAEGIITNLAEGRKAASQLFFFNGAKDAEMTAEMVNKLRARRGILLRDSALSGFGAAASMKGDMAKSQETANGLSTQARNAADLRGDIQANTATMLAIYAEITKQTAMQAQMLELQSAQTLSVDSTAKAVQ